MTPDHERAVIAASRDNHLTLRRVERQQHLIEKLYASGRRLTLSDLADDLGVAERTIARDIRRMRESGVPITVTTGRGGGASIDRTMAIRPVTLDLPELAVVLASLAALGPSSGESAEGAMRKLVGALPLPDHGQAGAEDGEWAQRDSNP